MIVFVEMPEGYEDATHIIVVSAGNVADTRQRAATVLRIVPSPRKSNPYTEEVEEIGVGALGALLADAARVIRGDRP